MITKYEYSLSQNRHSSKFIIFYRFISLRYSKSTSSTVLYTHLQNRHNIAKDTFSFNRKQRRLEEVLFGGESSKRMKKEDKAELIVSRKACIWLCRDLLPFSLMENVGFRDFWRNFNIESKPPSRSTVSREALDDVYACLAVSYLVSTKKFL